MQNNTTKITLAQAEKLREYVQEHAEGVWWHVNEVTLASCKQKPGYYERCTRDDATHVEVALDADNDCCEIVKGGLIHAGVIKADDEVIIDEMFYCIKGYTELADVELMRVFIPFDSESVGEKPCQESLLPAYGLTWDGLEKLYRKLHVRLAMETQWAYPLDDVGRQMDGDFNYEYVAVTRNTDGTYNVTDALDPFVTDSEYERVELCINWGYFFEGDTGSFLNPIMTQKMWEDDIYNYLEDGIREDDREQLEALDPAVSLDEIEFRSALSICNAALKRKGLGPIDSIDPNGTDVQRACYNCYHPVRRSLLAAYDWGFSTGRAWCYGGGDQTEDGFYDYGTLSRLSALNFFGFTSDLVSDGFKEVDFKVEGGRLYAKRQHGVVKFTRDIENPSSFSHDFLEAFIILLGTAINDELTRMAYEEEDA